MPLDEDLDWDEDAERVAYHEAGHAVAAVLCAVGWEEVRVTEQLVTDEGVAGLTTLVEGHHDDTTPANRAFISWAGSWAEARYLRPDNPWRALAAVQEVGGRTDMDYVYAYWNQPEQAPHDTDEQWARELDSVWSAVEALAERLSKQRVLRTPLHPDWEG